MLSPRTGFNFHLFTASPLLCVPPTVTDVHKVRRTHLGHTPPLPMVMLCSGLVNPECWGFTRYIYSFNTQHTDFLHNFMDLNRTKSLLISPICTLKFKALSQTLHLWRNSHEWDVNPCLCVYTYDSPWQIMAGNFGCPLGLIGWISNRNTN